MSGAGQHHGPLRLGLIGTGIGNSMAPAFHQRAGRLTGLDLTYDLLEQDDPDVDVAALIERCREAGYQGLNVTYPFKERAFHHVDVVEGAVARLGAVNTIVLTGDEAPRGFNTDYTGLMARWRRRWPDRLPGVVALIGTGGVGRASAMAMAELGAEEIRLFDLDSDRAKGLADALSAGFSDVSVSIGSSAENVVLGADGVINGTPLGMYFSPGTPVDLNAIGGQTWLFDAIYSPLETPLLKRAHEAGLDVLNGFELFLGQAFDAFERFTGLTLDADHGASLEQEMWGMVRARRVDS